MATRRESIPLHTTQANLETFLPDILPEQVCWTEEEYLRLTDDSNRLVEFTDGYLEVLPSPTDHHQSILQYLFLQFLQFVTPRGGKVHFAALRMRIRAGKFREPDLLLLCDAADSRRQNRYWLGADLVLEVVSPDEPERDLVTKRADYAEAGIPEYWIVNPEDETIRVLRLEAGTYAEHGVFGRGAAATSALLEGLVVPVDEVFDAR